MQGKCGTLPFMLLLRLAYVRKLQLYLNLRFAIFAANEGRCVFVHLCVLMFCCRTRSVTREEKNLTNFLKSPVDKWVENCYEVLEPIISVLHTLMILEL